MTCFYGHFMAELKDSISAEWKRRMRSEQNGREQKQCVALPENEKAKSDTSHKLRIYPFKTIFQVTGGEIRVSSEESMSVLLLVRVFPCPTTIAAEY